MKNDANYFTVRYFNWTNGKKKFGKNSEQIIKINKTSIYTANKLYEKWKLSIFCNIAACFPANESLSEFSTNIREMINDAKCIISTSPYSCPLVNND